MEWQELGHTLATNPTFWTAAVSLMAALATGYIALLSTRRTARTTERKDEALARTAANDAIRQDFQVFANEIRAERVSERAAWDTERQEYKAERKELHAKVDFLTDRVETLRARVSTLIDHVITLERFIKQEGKTPPKRPEGVD